MTEETIPQEIPVDAGQTLPKPKQFLLMADELHMAMLAKIMPGLLFVQVEGMGMQNNPNHMLLVNPVKVEAPPTQPIEPVK